MILSDIDYCIHIRFKDEKVLDNNSILGIVQSTRGYGILTLTLTSKTSIYYDKDRSIRIVKKIIYNDTKY